MTRGNIFFHFDPFKLCSVLKNFRHRTRGNIFYHFCSFILCSVLKNSRHQTRGDIFFHFDPFILCSVLKKFPAPDPRRYPFPFRSLLFCVVC